MREIKFRAYHHEEGNPLYTPIMMYSNTCDLSLFFQNVDSEPCSVEIMQYTGLKDKNGVEIYQGDVVKDYDQNLLCSVEFGYIDAAGVEYIGWYLISQDRQEKWQFCQKDSWGLEVIGNIHENKELLNEQI